MSFARNERDALCALLSEKGPNAPTLCEGWTTSDLAAHLVTRERRPDAALGIVIPPMAGYTASVQRKVASQHGYPELVEMIRQGPPRLSVFAIPGVDELANAVEFYVHHEDVRRGEPGWEVRELDPALEDLLWRRIGAARLLLRRAPCGITLRRDGGSGGQQITVKHGTPMVTVAGTAGELMLWTFGRTSAARVHLDGDAEAVARLNQAKWGI